MINLTNAHVMYAKVRKGIHPRREEISGTFLDSSSRHQAMAAYTGNIVAAMYLADKLFPDMPIRMSDSSADWLGGNGWCVKLNWPHKQWNSSFTAYPPDAYGYEHYASTPSRALLLCVIEALIAKTEHYIREAANDPCDSY